MKLVHDAALSKVEKNKILRDAVCSLIIYFCSQNNIFKNRKEIQN